jgi:hypothetical protein
MKNFKFIVALFVALALPIAANAAALSASRQTQSKNPGAIKRYLMKASTAIYAGGMVAIDTDGLAIPAGASAGNHGVVGVAVKSQTSAGSGSYYIEAQEGWFLFAGDTLQQEDVGVMVYADDDQTVDETQANNAPVVGVLVEYVSASSGWVHVSPIYQARTNVVTEPLVLTGAVTLAEGATFGQPANNKVGITENAEDIVVEFKANEAELSSTTGVVTFDFGAVLPISSGTGALGWALVAGANTACNTTCAHACVFGQNTADMTLVACSSADADVCLCAGAN